MEMIEFESVGNRPSNRPLRNSQKNRFRRLKNKHIKAATIIQFYNIQQFLLSSMFKSI